MFAPSLTRLQRTGGKDLHYVDVSEDGRELTHLSLPIYNFSAFPYQFTFQTPYQPKLTELQSSGFVVIP